MHRVPATGNVQEVASVLQHLFPLCRSLAGPANRETLRFLQTLVPLTIHEYPSGTPVYDWTIPDEWHCREAWIKGPDGRTLVDFAACSLHVMSYSTAISGSFTLEELEAHLFRRPDLPSAIPYRTSYYTKNWGFCLSEDQYQRDFAPHASTGSHEAPRFTVHIDAAHTHGSLSVGELLIPGELPDEILLSTYCCHPALANDNLSGTVLTAFLARELLQRKNKYSYRVIFVPETIGAIAYCAENEAAMKAIDAGFVITCVAGKGPWGYKATFDEKHRVNRVVEETFAAFGLPVLRYPFDPHGSDERQYASPGFRINTASICKDKYYEYQEYHCSLDTLEFAGAEALSRSLTLYLAALERLEAEEFYRRSDPHCEVMLSPRGLYPGQGGGMMPGDNSGQRLDAILWLLMLMDGRISLGDAATRTGLPLDFLRETAHILVGQGLLETLPGPLPKRSI